MEDTLPARLYTDVSYAVINSGIFQMKSYDDVYFLNRLDEKDRHFIIINGRRRRRADSGSTTAQQPFGQNFGVGRFDKAVCAGAFSME